MLKTHGSPGRLHSRLLRLERYFAAQSLRLRHEKPSPKTLPILQLDAWAGQYLQGYFTRPFSLFHVWLVEQLQDLHTRRATRLALVAPRGSAKSTWISLAYPLWAALNRYEPYILRAGTPVWGTAGAGEEVSIILEMSDGKALKEKPVRAGLPAQVARPCVTPRKSSCRCPTRRGRLE